MKSGATPAFYDCSYFLTSQYRYNELANDLGMTLRFRLAMGRRIVAVMDDRFSPMRTIDSHAGVGDRGMQPFSFFSGKLPLKQKREMLTISRF